MSLKLQKPGSAAHVHWKKDMNNAHNVHLVSIRTNQEQLDIGTLDSVHTHSGCLGTALSSNTGSSSAKTLVCLKEDPEME